MKLVINNIAKKTLDIFTALLLTTSSASTVAATPHEESSLEYLKSLKLEDLLATEITSVSKKPEKLADAAAAAFVITAEDIKRTGTNSIPEALRMVPGLQVAQITASSWAISSRGFTDLFSNKLLVLIDGRSVYTPLFSGVFWELQDTAIEDIDRIEVIRGPGATLWGSNAVNGVINIITKSSLETQGVLVSGAVGTSNTATVTTRVGNRLGENGSYRIYAKGNLHDNNVDENGDDTHDSWKNIRSGFRTDLTPSKDMALTIQGDIYKGEEELTYRFPGLISPEDSEDRLDYKGLNLQTKLMTDRKNGSTYSLQAYYDYATTESKIPGENRHTFDLDFQYQYNLTPRQEIIWGLGYRLSNDDISKAEVLCFNPDSKTEHLYSGFLQDEITLQEDSLWLTLGSKFEHNDYSGLEIQPNIRARWHPAENQTVWAAVSRAVRAPSRADHDIDASAQGTVDESGNRVKVKILGRDDFESEELIAYEAGHRWSPRNNFSLDTAFFYNVYDNLRSLDVGVSYIDVDSISPFIVVPTYIENNIDADTYGFEFLASWQPFPYWKLNLGYSYMQASFEGLPESQLQEQQFKEDDFPEHQVQLRSYFDINDAWSFDTEIYYVDELTGRDIDGYVRIDLRIGWQINPTLDLSLNVENLTDEQHAEFGNANSLQATEIPRNIYAKLTWSY